MFINCVTKFIIHIKLHEITSLILQLMNISYVPCDYFIMIFIFPLFNIFSHCSCQLQLYWDLIYCLHLWWQPKVVVFPMQKFHKQKFQLNKFQLLNKRLFSIPLQTVSNWLINKYENKLNYTNWCCDNVAS